MTENTPPQQLPQLAAQFVHAVGPDGVARIMVQFGSGRVGATIAIDLDKADTAADQLAEGIKAAAAQARRALSGLVIPQVQIPADIAQLVNAQAPNGHKQP